MFTLREFTDKVLPKAVSSGDFGKNAELIRVVKDLNSGADQFASDVLFVDIELKVDGGKKHLPLVCKFQCESAEKRAKFKTDIQFFNEVTVYKEIVPLFPICVKDVLPEFYHGKASMNDRPEEDIIIVENLIPKGFRQSAERLFLDFEHCSLVFRTLGKLHGASIYLKSNLQHEFNSLLSKLKETRWLEEFKEEHNYFFGENAKRGVTKLIQRGEHLEILTQFLSKLENVYDIMSDVLTVNALSLLNHGDFCRNNMVFRYEKDRPVDMKVFDLATARFCSPVLDISFFLFMNVPLEIRRKYLKELFEVYLEGLQSVAGEDAFSMDDLWKEFQQKAVYGYIVTAFFIPIMFDPPDTLDANLKTLTLQERVKRNLVRGGDEVTNILCENVKDLISWESLQ